MVMMVGTIWNRLRLAQVRVVSTQGLGREKEEDLHGRHDEDSAGDASVVDGGLGAARVSGLLGVVAKGKDGGNDEEGEQDALHGNEDAAAEVGEVVGGRLHEVEQGTQEKSTLDHDGDASLQKSVSIKMEDKSKNRRLV